MSRKIKIFMPCNEANNICNKAQYKEASLLEKLKLNLHLIYCKACRGYSLNNSKLTKRIEDSKLECLDPKCKEDMKKDLEKALKEQLH